MSLAGRVRRFTTNPTSRAATFTTAAIAVTTLAAGAPDSDSWCALVAGLFGNLAMADAGKSEPTTPLREHLANENINRILGRTIGAVVQAEAVRLGEAGWSFAEGVPDAFLKLALEDQVPFELRFDEIPSLFRLEPGQTVREMLEDSPLEQGEWRALLGVLDTRSSKGVSSAVLDAAAKRLASRFAWELFTVLHSQSPDADPARHKLQLMIDALDQQATTEAIQQATKEIAELQPVLKQIADRVSQLESWLRDADRPRGYVPGSDGFEHQGDALHFSHRSPPYIGRTADRNKFQAFWSRPEPFLWEVIHGPAGDGKSRFGLWCVEHIRERMALRREDADAFFLDMNQFQAADPVWRKWRLDRPTLVVIDYVYRHLDQVAQVLRELHTRAARGDLTGKLRVLLLERAYVFPALEAALRGVEVNSNHRFLTEKDASDNPLQGLMGGANLDVRIGWELGDLRQGDLEAILRYACEVSGQRYEHATAKKEIARLFEAELARPLWAILAGLGLGVGSVRADGDLRVRLIQALVDPEWERAVQTCGGDRAKAGAFLAPLLAATTVKGSSDAGAGSGLSLDDFLALGELPSICGPIDLGLPGIDEQRRTCFGRVSGPEPDIFHPVLPDIVGEHLVLDVLAGEWPRQGNSPDPNLAPALAAWLRGWMHAAEGSDRVAALESFLVRALDSFPNRCAVIQEFRRDAQERGLPAVLRAMGHNEVLDEPAYDELVRLRLLYNIDSFIIDLAIARHCNSIYRLKQVAYDREDQIRRSIPSDSLAWFAFSLATKPSLPAVDVALKVLRELYAAHPDDPAVRENYAMALVNRTVLAPEADLEGGALKILREMYDAHSDGPIVRKAYAKALENWTIHDSTADVLAGALKVLREMYDAHADDPTVREAYATALAKHSACASNGDLEAGALKVLRKMYDARSDDPTVREAYATALANQTASASDDDLVAGALNSLRAMYDAHSDDPTVRKAYATALANHTARATETDLEEGALACLRNLYENHPEDPGVRMPYATVLFDRALLASETDLDGGALKVLRKMHGAHPDDAAVREKYADALYNRTLLSSETDLEAGALKVLREMHDAHPDDPVVREEYMTALVFACRRSQRSSSYDTSLRFVFAIRAVVDQFPDVRPWDVEAGAAFVILILYSMGFEEVTSQLRTAWRHLELRPEHRIAKGADYLKATPGESPSDEPST